MRVSYGVSKLRRARKNDAWRNECKAGGNEGPGSLARRSGVGLAALRAPRDASLDHIISTERTARDLGCRERSVGQRAGMW